MQSGNTAYVAVGSPGLYYKNGISRALSRDYNDFVVTGKLTSLKIKAPKPCP
jgi:hypothetical protein